VDQDTLSGTITYLTDTHIGNWNNASEWFGGDLTQVQFYTSTLSSSTLTSIFNAGLLQNVFSFGPANWFQMVGPVGPDTTSTLHDSITAATCAGSNLTIVNSVPN
jgi:hypothetical protein